MNQKRKYDVLNSKTLPLPPPSISFLNLLYPTFSNHKCNDEKNKMQTKAFKAYKETNMENIKSQVVLLDPRTADEQSLQKQHIWRWIGLCYQQHTEDELEEWKHQEKKYTSKMI